MRKLGIDKNRSFETIPIQGNTHCNIFKNEEIFDACLRFEHVGVEKYTLDRKSNGRGT